jgi:hypothetical protein
VPLTQTGVSQAGREPRGQLMERSADQKRAHGMDITAVGTGGDPGHGPARALYEALGYTPLQGVTYLRLLD